MTDLLNALLQFGPLLLIIVLANLGERARLFQWLTFAALVLVNLILILAGSALAIGAVASQGGVVPGEGALVLDNPVAGLAAMGAGLLGFLPLVPRIRRTIASWLPINPDHAVHTTALVFSIYLVGLTVAQFSLDLADLVAAGAQLTAAAAWAQGLAFMLFGLLGVGVGIRRSWSQTLERLGLTRLSRRQIALGLGVMVVLQVFDLTISYVWAFVDPESFNELSEITRGLLGQFTGPLGALTIGLSAGFGEEILFRGAVQPRFGLWLTTVLFTIGHVQYSISPALFEVFIIGLILGVIRQRENTSTCILIHATYNAVNVLLTPLFPGQ